MTRGFNVIIERDSEGYFVASVPSLAGCHTQAKSLDELIERIKEAFFISAELLQLLLMLDNGKALTFSCQSSSGNQN